MNEEKAERKRADESIIYQVVSNPMKLFEI